jgi:mono/diheme cytochrome c family protein
MQPNPRDGAFWPRSRFRWMTSLRTAPLWLALALGWACGDPAPTREWTAADHGQPERADPDRTPNQADAVEESDEQALARAAAALWSVSCAGCHGRDGRGQGASRPPGAQIADFTDVAWQTSRSDAQLVQTIREGRGLMPAFGQQINDHGLRALTDHIRKLGGAARAPAAAHAGSLPGPDGG